MNLYYPVRDPINQQNLFGANPEWYKAHLNQNGHPGNDFESPSGTKAYSPCDGSAAYITDPLGGDGIWIRNTSDGENHVVILWHLYPKGNPQYPFQIPTDGSWNLVKAGDLLAYTDNSGAPRESSGPHLHLGVLACNPDWTPRDPNNGFQGCVDPKPFYNGMYAEDIPVLDKAIQTSEETVQTIVQSPLPNTQKISLLAKVAQFLINLFHL